MRGEQRKGVRVRLEHRRPVNLVGVDGTWRRACLLLDVSDTGAKIEVEGSIDVLQAREFFLVLSSNGLAYRRCEFDLDRRSDCRRALREKTRLLTRQISTAKHDEALGEGARRMSQIDPVGRVGLT